MGASFLVTITYNVYNRILCVPAFTENYGESRMRGDSLPVCHPLIIIASIVHEAIIYQRVR